MGRIENFGKFTFDKNAMKKKVALSDLFKMEKCDSKRGIIR